VVCRFLESALLKRSLAGNYRILDAMAASSISSGNLRKSGNAPMQMIPALLTDLVVRQIYFL
jgi:hypothetical protein